METYKNENPENAEQNQEGIAQTQSMEKDDISNPDQFQVGRTSEENTSQQDDSKYTPEEDQFADGKGTVLAEEFDSPDPEEIEDDEADELDHDLEIDDNKDLNQELN